MRIFYSQTKESTPNEPLFRINNLKISGCRFHYEIIKSEHDERNATKKSHSHTGFEIHLVGSGRKRYQTEDCLFDGLAGTYLLIPPNKKHRMLHTTYPLKKYSFSFSLLTDCDRVLDCATTPCICREIPPIVLQNLHTIVSEFQGGKAASSFVVANRIFESVVLLLQDAGTIRMDLQRMDVKEQTDIRVELAKQYVRDNAREPITVTDLTGYCHLSQKQLTRLFLEFEGMTPAAFIRSERILQIEKLLRDPQRTLKSISEEMSFPNEYCFNTFFKKYYGMTPGKYRKMQ